MKEFILTQEETERTVLVGLITNTQNEAKANEYLDELAFLAETAGALPVKKFLQRLDTPNSRTFVGSGKLSEIKAYIEENEIGMVIFDDDLSSKQVQNIERELQVKILDRTSLILDIFCQTGTDCQCQTSGRTGTIPISVAPTHPAVDSPRTTTRRYRHAWTRRNSNRDRPAYHSR